MSTQYYYKKKLVSQNIEVEYSSEEDEIGIVFHHKFKNGGYITTDYLRMHPSYVEPLIELLRNVTKPEVEE